MFLINKTSAAPGKWQEQDDRGEAEVASNVRGELRTLGLYFIVDINGNTGRILKSTFNIKTYKQK